jgi:toxin ParE1/3/4
MPRPRRVVWSPEAEQDLLDIWAYLAREASTRVADEQLRSIDRVCDMLSEAPLLGRSRDELLPGIRSIAAQPYVIFYRAPATHIEVVHVLHGSRDIDTIFSEPGA